MSGSGIKNNVHTFYVTSKKNGRAQRIVSKSYDKGAVRQTE